VFKTALNFMGTSQEKNRQMPGSYVCWKNRWYWPSNSGLKWPSYLQKLQRLLNIWLTDTDSSSVDTIVD